MSFLAELRRRNVIRMAGLYLVGAWLITQVAGTLLPMFEAPAWVARTIVMLLAIGFVPTLIFSWVYELTPEGLKRDAEVPPEKSIAQHTGRRIDFAIIGVLLVALVYFGVDRFVFEPRRIAQARVEAAQPARRGVFPCGECVAAAAMPTAHSEALLQYAEPLGWVELRTPAFADTE